VGVPADGIGRENDTTGEAPPAPENQVAIFHLWDRPRKSGRRDTASVEVPSKMVRKMRRAKQHRHQWRHELGGIKLPPL
jgi:hypothetical protein